MTRESLRKPPVPANRSGRMLEKFSSFKEVEAQVKQIKRLHLALTASGAGRVHSLRPGWTAVLNIL